MNLIPLRQLGCNPTRPSIRIHAQDFKRVDTVSGDKVHTAEITWYRNGQLALPILREILWVDSKPAIDVVHDG